MKTKHILMMALLVTCLLINAQNTYTISYSTNTTIQYTVNTNTIVLSNGNIGVPYTNTVAIYGYELIGGQTYTASIPIFTTGTYTTPYFSVNRSVNTSTILITNNTLAKIKMVNGCTYTNGATIADQMMFNILQTTTGIENSTQDLRTKVYPNPVLNEFYVDLNENRLNAITLNLYNSTGELVMKEAYYGLTEPKKVNIEKLSSCIYFLHISVDGKSAIQKIVKE